MRPGSDAAVIRIRGTKKGIALTVDCNSRYCYLDPRAGSHMAVAEAARNLVCSGAKPLAVTDSLNFAALKSRIASGSAGRRSLESEKPAGAGYPVISGNVSFTMKQKHKQYILPPIGMVGVIDEIDRFCTMSFKDEGDAVILLGETGDELEAVNIYTEYTGLRGGGSTLALAWKRNFKIYFISNQEWFS